MIIGFLSIFLLQNLDPIFSIYLYIGNVRNMMTSVLFSEIYINWCWRNRECKSHLWIVTIKVGYLHPRMAEHDWGCLWMITDNREWPQLTTVDRSWPHLTALDRGLQFTWEWLDEKSSSLDDKLVSSSDSNAARLHLFVLLPASQTVPPLTNPRAR